MTENEISYKIIGGALNVYKILGPGLLESAYKECLNYKLLQAGLSGEKEKRLPITFEETMLDSGYKIDLLIQQKVVIEIKSVK